MSAALRASFAIALLAALIAVPGISPGAIPEVDITSDRLEQRDGMYVFTGSVRFKNEDYTLRSDSAVYNGADSTMVAEGSVIINSAEFRARGERADMDIDKATGVLYDAEIHFLAGNYFVNASEMEMLGDGHFLLKDADITTCVDTPPAWCLRASTVDVLVGERIKASHAKFKVNQIPVFYTPYLWAPIVTDRRSGLLPPNLGYRESTGLHISQPYFWAISENRDATFTLDYHTDEALGQEIEYRYIEAPHINGQWNILHLRDTEHAVDYIETMLQHRHDGQPVAGFLDTSTINREDYYRLYDDYLEDSAKRYLESKGELYVTMPPEKPFGNSRIYLSAKYYQDLKEGVEQDSVLQRTPEAGISIAPFGPGPLDVFGRLRAVQFEREEGVEGSRADLEAGASLTLGSAIILRQEAGVARHEYELSGGGLDQQSPNQTSYTYSADLSLTTSRAYGALLHEIEPSLIFNRSILKEDYPVFFDHTESQVDESFATLQVVSRLFGDDQTRLLSFRLTQPYDFLAEEKPYKPLVAELSATQPNGPLSASLSLTYDHYEKYIDSMTSNLKAAFRRVSIEVGQSYSRSSDIETYSTEGRFNISDRTEVFAGLKYDEAEESGLEETSVGLIYNKQCWGLKLTYVKKPDDYSVYVEFNLLGLGGAGIN